MTTTMTMKRNGGQLYGRGMAFPPLVGSDGAITWSEGEQNIRESIQIILQTEAKERLNLPTFGAGLQQFLFEPNTVTTQTQIADRITKALQIWEPRISLIDVAVDEDPNDALAAIATIQYRLVATQVKQRTTMTVQLAS